MELPAITRVMAEGGGDAFGGLGINAFLIIAQIVNFIFLLLFLNGLIIRPILKGLENRRARIDESLENARKADERLANVERDYQARLSEASAEAQKLRAETLLSAQTDLERIRKDAQIEAEHIKAQAHIDAMAARNSMLAGLRPQVSALAMAAANKIIGDSLDAQRQQSLINDFFARVPATLLAGVEVAGPIAVNVTSALPLSDDEKAAVKADLAKQMSQIGDLSFDVDPGILGGLVVRVGDKVIDGSVSGKMTALRQSLNA